MGAREIKIATASAKKFVFLPTVVKKWIKIKTSTLTGCETNVCKTQL